MDFDRVGTWALRLRRAAWWVFVVAALATGKVAWLDLGNGRTVTYNGSYTPLDGVDMTKAYSTSFSIDYSLRGGPEWSGIVTACAAAVVVIAAIAQAVVVRRRLLVAVATVAGSVAAITAVAAAVNGIGGITFRTSLVVVIVLAAVALHEIATAAGRPIRDKPVAT